MWIRFAPVELDEPFEDAESVLASRRDECDDYYRALQPDYLTDDQRLVQRQALAGLLWCKQFYNYHVTRWLEGDPTGPHRRNSA